ncbi:MAG: methyltransferase domain-containing protein [Caldimonas sp.]
MLRRIDDAGLLSIAAYEVEGVPVEGERVVVIVGRGSSQHVEVLERAHLQLAHRDADLSVDRLDHARAQVAHHVFSGLQVETFVAGHPEAFDHLVTDRTVDVQSHRRHRRRFDLGLRLGFGARRRRRRRRRRPQRRILQARWNLRRRGASGKRERASEEHRPDRAVPSLVPSPVMRITFVESNHRHLFMHEPQNSDPADTFKQRDAASYDDVVDRFERYTEQFTLPIARHLVGLARLDPQARILDVGCGTGVVTRLAAAGLGPKGRVVGLDLSDGMLRKAAELAQVAPGGDRIEFRKGDAERLDFETASFDATLSLYALRHLPHPRLALKEMLRVTRPGSIAVVGIGSAAPTLSTGFFAGAAWRAADLLRSVVGRGALRATGFLDRLVARHGSDEGHGTADAVGDLAQAMRDAGYVDVRHGWVGQASMIASVEEFWGLQVTLSSHARKTLAAMDASTLAELRREFDAICERHARRGGSFVYRSGAMIATGRRPA